MEVELTRYESSEQASEALQADPPSGMIDEGVQVEDAGERGGVMAREWDANRERRHGSAHGRVALDIRRMSWRWCAVTRSRPGTWTTTMCTVWRRW